MVFEDSDLNTALVTGGTGFIGTHLVGANLPEAETPLAAGMALNVCGDESVSILDLAETLSGILSGVSAPEFAPARAGDKYLSQGDPSRAEQVLDFRVQLSLAEGLTETVEWMQT